MATDEDTLNRYYDLLEEALKADDLLDKPAAKKDSSCSGDTLSNLSSDVNLQVLILEDDQECGTKGNGL